MSRKENSGLAEQSLTQHASLSARYGANGKYSEYYDTHTCDEDVESSIVCASFDDDPSFVHVSAFASGISEGNPAEAVSVDMALNIAQFDHLIDILIKFRSDVRRKIHEQTR